MEYSTRFIATLQNFVKACEKAGIVVWVRSSRQKYIVSLDNKRDTKRANEIALMNDMEF
jgi:hypothetical protein